MDRKRTAGSQPFRPLEKEKPLLSPNFGRLQEGKGQEEHQMLSHPISNSTLSDCLPDCNSSALRFLNPYHRKCAHALAENVNGLISLFGLDSVGFLTLTFADNVTDHNEAYSRFRSFNSHFLAPHPSFGHWLCVKERQKRGAWHYHLLIYCGADIRTGTDLEAFSCHDYRTAGEHLRRLWADLRDALPEYGFGRHELLPVISNASAISRYVGKYISKHIDSRQEEDKGVRLVSYSRNWSRSNANFAWNTPNAQDWRAKVASFAEYVGCESMDGLKALFGSRWAYVCAGIIMSGIDERKAAFDEERAQRRRGDGEGFPPFPEIVGNRDFEEEEKKKMRQSKPQSEQGADHESDA